MDAIDRVLINQLQRGFPICERPYAIVAAQFALSEQALIQRLQALLDDNILTRFGPLYHAERMGGALTLVAMSVPENDFDRVAEQVNSLPQVAHNYARQHRLNMWFVLATETVAEIEQVLQQIEQLTGYQVYNMPKLEEFYVGLHFRV